MYNDEVYEIEAKLSPASWSSYNFPDTELYFPTPSYLNGEWYFNLIRTIYLQPKDLYKSWEPAANNHIMETQLTKDGNTKPDFAPLKPSGYYTDNSVERESSFTIRKKGVISSNYSLITKDDVKESSKSIFPIYLVINYPHELLFMRIIHKRSLLPRCLWHFNTFCL